MPHGLNFTLSPLFENLLNEEPMQFDKGSSASRDFQKRSYHQEGIRTFEATK